MIFNLDLLMDYFTSYGYTPKLLMCQSKMVMQEHQRINLFNRVRVI